MASSPLSGILSAAQIAAIQQARATIQGRTPPQTNDLAQTQPDKRIPAPPARGRGQIIDITV